MTVPIELYTTRLLLRPWRGHDAEELLPVLETNQLHLGPWIPTRISRPAPLPLLTERLAGFAADFEASREWRYALFSRDDSRLLGEVALFPRSAAGRVPFDAADRAEIGYWLREDAAGRGLATEATEAMLGVAAALPAFTRLEIRCDADNVASGAIPRRLGFVLEATAMAESVVEAAPAVALQVWSLALDR